MKKIISMLLILVMSLTLLSTLALATDSQKNEGVINLAASDRILWASAFSITNSHANRAFLGWNGLVYPSNTALFADEFWPLVGTMSIQNAAVQAAAEVPGVGTTPIRFYGDTSYYGTAWN